jgi:hypothetical protein
MLRIAITLIIVNRLRARCEINRLIGIPFLDHLRLDTISRNPRNSAAIASVSRNRLKPKLAQIWAPIDLFILQRALRLSRRFRYEIFAKYFAA